MSSKFSQVRNKRSKPPHCKPGPIGLPPYQDQKPKHLYCNIHHELELWDIKYDYHFHPWEWPGPAMYDFEWHRTYWRNSAEKLHYSAFLDINNDMTLFTLTLYCITSLAEKYIFHTWYNRPFDRHFPITTPTLRIVRLHVGGQSVASIFVTDTGKAYPPPEAGNYGPY